MKWMLKYILPLLVLMLVNTVYAAEYNTDSNSVTGIDDNTYSTVMIFKYDELSGGYDYNNIIYFNQSADNTFMSSTIFLLKNNPADGKYIVRISGSGKTDELEFYIGTPIGYMDIESDQAFWTEGTMSFIWEALNLSEYNSVIIMVGDDPYCIALSEFSKPENIDGPVSVGLQLTNVPDGPEIRAYLSKGILSGSVLDVSEPYKK